MFVILYPAVRCQRLVYEGSDEMKLVTVKYISTLLLYLGITTIRKHHQCIYSRRAQSTIIDHRKSIDIIDNNR